ncbi:hypothetical protein ACS8E3_07680 [Psychrobacter sp. 2Y5]|uniref:hypothetical protein n=1 Tax=unclassified Psychrobacter TaxID=196806 RepID=UPI003F47D0DF
MIGRTIVQKDDEVSVTEKEGKALVAKGAAIELATPQPAVAKPETTKKTDSKTKEDKAD